MTVDEYQLLKFLEELKEGAYYLAIQQHMQSKRLALMETLAVTNTRHDDMITLQGRIQELNNNPIDSLIEELKDKQKQREGAEDEDITRRA